MKMLIFPAVESERLRKMVEAAEPMLVVNAAGEEAAVREIAEADAFFGKLTPPLLAAAGRLRWVQSPTASLEHYMFPALVDHPCQLTNMRGLYADVIADHVFGYILCFARNFPRYIRQQLQSHWEAAGGEAGRSGFILGPSSVSTIDRAHRHLPDSTLGIVGLGSIGSEVARRALAFGMRVLAVDPQQRQAPDGVESLWKPDRLSDLLSASDFVVVAAPHTPETEKLFRRPLFQRMKPEAYFINIGRGMIVDLADLTEALRAGEIAGAGLDVFETEPLPPEHPLWKMDNVILTPHVAAASPRTAERHLALLLDNVRRFAGGRPLRNLVDKAKWF
jgi:phosphoglycerate dehydrogenase-like enzyme